MRRYTALALLALTLSVASMVSSQPCNVMVNGQVFDFSPLRQPSNGTAWVVLNSTTPSPFFVNVCGPLPSSSNQCQDVNSAACGLVNSTFATFGSSVNFTLAAITPTGSGTIAFSLTYRGGLNNQNQTSPKANNGTCKGLYDRETVILFTCGESLGAPIYITQEENCRVVLQWPTILACAPAPAPVQAECLVIDDVNNVAYDLTQLIKINSNWVAIDDNETYYYTYVINPCAALVSTSRAQGACVGASACQSIRNPPTVSNLNYASLGAVASPQLDGGELVMVLTGGSPCNGGASTYNTTIYFECDTQIGLGHPVFAAFDGVCAFEFTWLTSAACPIILPNASSCSVVDPVGGQIFDLSSLPQKRIASSNTTAFLFGACGKSMCASVSGVVPAVCSLSGGVTTNLGAIPHPPVFQDGQISMTFTNGSVCNGGGRISSTVLFVCDPTGTLQASLAQNSSCQYVFIYPTPLVCLSEVLECVATGPDGSQYDLSQLSLATSNWDIFDYNNNFYEINVCHPVNDVTCPYNSGVCLFSASSTSGSGANLGNALLEPSFDANGNLVLVYPLNTTQTATCPNGTFSIIEFQCVSGSLGVPSFVSSDNCATYFLWPSSAACPQQVETGGNCILTDLQSGYTYNLYSLRNRVADYQVSASYLSVKYNYTLNLCGPLINNCSNITGAGGCQTYTIGKRVINNVIGYPATQLTLTNNQLSSYGSGGTPCTNKVPRSYTINFVCDPTKSGQQGPEFVTEFSCSYEFLWRTALVCPTAPSLPCSYDNQTLGLFVDFSPLRNPNANWQFTDPKTGLAFELNVCQNLIADASNCPVASGACLIDQSGIPKSIGMPSFPTLDPTTGSFYISYVGGLGGCNGQTQRSSRIDFVCSRNAGIGQPSLVAIDQNCRYIFQWPTTVVCPQQNSSSGFCYTTDPITQQRFSFASLNQPKGTAVSVAQYRGYSFVVNPCMPINCTSSVQGAVCVTLPTGVIISGGQANGQVIQENGVLALHYSNGGSCLNSVQATSIVTFICNANTSAPTLLSMDVVQCVFKFLWKTPLACPNHVGQVSCRVGDYDLSPLINNNANWLATDDREGGKYVYQINVCRTLVITNQSLHCNPSMAACQVTPYDANPLTWDLGRLQTAPQLDRRGNLFIVYPSGQFCNGTYARTTIIQFICPRDSNNNPIPGLIGHPSFSYQGSQCNYFFTWTTSFACPINSFVGTNCKVTDTDRGVQYDLTPLVNPYSNYLVTVGFTKFILNVCLNVQQSQCLAGSSSIGACAIDTSTNNVYSLGTPSTSPLFDGGALTLTYTGGSPCPSNPSFSRSTTIEFICDATSTPGSANSAPHLIDSDGCSNIFEWPTSIACATAQTVECLVFDHAHQVYYDLSVLADPYQNWRANQLLPNGTSYSYEINVCRTLVPDTNFPGCPYNAATCQIAVSPSGYSFIEQSLGQIGIPLLAADGKHVYIQYSNGSACPTAPGVMSSTRIDFYCPKSGSQQTGPVFLSSNSQCQYFFSWTTQAACSISTNGVTTTVAPGLLRCQAYDATNNYAYNLNKMSATVVVANISRMSQLPAGTQITLQLCNLTVNAVQMKSSSGVVTVIGNYTEDPIVTDGVLSMTLLTNTPCGGSSLVQSYIMFVCDPTQGVGMARYVGIAPDNCTYQFQWRTIYACTPSQNQVPCSLEDPLTGKQYDLSPLTMYNGTNWVVSARDPAVFPPQTYEYQINVCRVIVPFQNSSGTECENAGACQTNPRVPSQNLYDSLGQVASPVINNGVISLTYHNPDPSGVFTCHYVNSRTITITFQCMPGSLGAPVFLSESPTCVYSFLWQTSAACSLTQIPGQNCQVRDPTTGLSFDMSPLSSSDYNITTSDGSVYVLHVCGAVASNPSCPAGSGACVIPSSGAPQSLGVNNSALIFSDVSLSLAYSNGGQCANNPAQSRTTNIQFACNVAAGAGQPSLINDDGCTASVRWETSYACANQQRVPCVYVDANGNSYDLSALSESASNFVTNDTNSTAQYVLSVCHSLLPQAPAKGCAAGSAACRVAGKSSINLGYVTALNTVNGALTATYVNGDKCGANNQLSSSVVTFVCDTSPNASVAGSLVYTGNNSCVYNFVWTTSAACPISYVVGSNCMVTSPFSKQVIDLTPLSTQMWTVASSSNQDVYNIRICQPLSTPCGSQQGVGVCLTNSNPPTSFGVANSTLIASDNTVTINLIGGSACPSNPSLSLTSQVSFTCQPCVNLGSSGPQLVQDNVGCSTNFLWPTPLVCSPDELMNCSSTAPPVTFTTTTAEVYTTGPTKNTTAPPTTIAPAPASSSSKSATVAGAVVGSLIGAVLLVGLAYYFYRRGKKTSNFSIHSGDVISMNNDHQLLVNDKDIEDDEL